VTEDIDKNRLKAGDHTREPYIHVKQYSVIRLSLTRTPSLRHWTCGPPMH